MQIADRVSLWAGKKSPLPSGARWVEYLESTGTQYINTGYRPNATTKWVLDYQFLTNPSTFAADGMFQTRGGTWRFNIGVNATNFNMSIGNDNHLPVACDTLRHRFVADAVNKTWQIDANGGSTSPNSYIGNNSIPLFVFARNGESTSTIYNIHAGRFFSSQIYKNGNLELDFRPIAIGTTGYFLDLVSGEYLPYGNVGTGDFIVGPDAPVMTGGGYKRLCVKGSHRRSSRPSARFWHAAHLPRTWKEAA